MTSSDTSYIKLISQFFLSLPQEVVFTKENYSKKKTWKIGVKKDCDLTRE